MKNIIAIRNHMTIIMLNADQLERCNQLSENDLKSLGNIKQSIKLLDIEIQRGDEAPKDTSSGASYERT